MSAESALGLVLSALALALPPLRPPETREALR